jgi:hypothetical protein
MKITFITIVFLFLSFIQLVAQTLKETGKTDSVELSTKINTIERLSHSLSKLQLGGYGEAVMSRHFYSDNINRYTHAANYKDAKSHGRIDLPHVVFMIGYDFGKGWRMNAEIEFEHGGAEAAMELEAEEAGEFESEIERGGEVALEQFWIEKTFTKAFNLRLGHIIVPVGLTNSNHLPTQFFTVYRPEGENTIMPCTWHETGISLWGNVGKWRYELQLVPGLDSDLFSRQGWIKGASASPYEFKVANKYAGVFRIDNHSVPGLRMGISSYYGYSFKNSIQPATAEKYKNINGAVAIGSFDFEYDRRSIIARGYFDYGHLGNSGEISAYNKSLSKLSPSPRTNVASDALCAGIEFGYDVFSQINSFSSQKQKLYVFGRYEQYDSMYKTAANIMDNEWCGRQVFVGGINYFPVKEIVIKAEYSSGILKSQYNNENRFSIGIAYAGYFLK